MYPGETTREIHVSRAFVSLADTLVDNFDIINLLDRLVAYSVELLAADAGGILLSDARRELRVVAASNEDAELMELLQVQNDEGPCMECFRNAAPVMVEDIAAADRWPAFTAAVATAGPFRAVHAVPLRLRGEAIGALNLFHRRPGARAARRAEVVNEQLQAALNSRVIIEQAKGVLAERGELTMDAAFDRLRRFARNNNLRLSEVAAQVVTNKLGVEVLAATATPTSTPRQR